MRDRVIGRRHDVHGHVVVAAITIAAQTVRFIFAFSLGFTLRPTTTGRTLDVSAGGEAGLDWANIGSPTTAQNLSGTSTKAVEPTVAGRTLDVSATGEAGVDWANVGGQGTAVSLTATTIATVTTTTTATNLTTNNDKTGYALSAAGVDAIWDEVQSGHVTAGTFGLFLDAAVTSRLAPTVAARTLDVSATGGAGVDWSNVESQATAVNLSATTVNLVNTLTTYTGNTVQTGDAFARLGAPAGASIAADIATRATPAQVNTEVLDVFTVDTFAEPTAVPAATATLKDKIGWQASLARNKLTQSTTTATLRNDADAASIATAAVTDDGTTFTRAEWV